jgi:hypothetical protein
VQLCAVNFLKRLFLLATVGVDYQAVLWTIIAHLTEELFELTSRRASLGCSSLPPPSITVFFNVLQPSTT